MSAPQSEAQPPPPLPPAVLSSKVSELMHVCVGLGMAPPEFNYVSKQQVSSSALPAKEAQDPGSQMFTCPDVFTGPHHLSGEAGQRADGPRSTVPLRE